MNHLRQFCAAVTLVCAFAFSAYAGAIECPAIVDPPPSLTATGEMLQPIVEAIALAVLSLS
jgi:hypothetical protein